MARTKVVRGTCTVAGCERPHKAAGFCASHYQRHKRGASTDVVLKTRDRNPPEQCTEADCAEPVKSLGLCQKHYARLLRHGHTRFRDRKKPPRICTVDGCDNWWYAKGLCSQHYKRRAKLRDKYGLTLESTMKMLVDQGGVCAICKGTANRINGKSLKGADFDVDHCHKTGRVRALLCNECNTGLGKFKDDPALLRSAAAYLELHAGVPAPL